MMPLLLSEWELMAKFNAGNCCTLFSALGERMQLAASLEPRQRIEQAWINNTKIAVLMPAGMMAAELELMESLAMIKRLFEDWEKNITAEEFRYGLYHLSRLIESEMRKRLCFGIPEHLSKYANNERPCGDLVYEAFPSSRMDLQEAGSCLACGLNNASAFHLMRASEIGLWELGRDRQIPLSKGPGLEFSEWGKIIKELEDAVKAIQQWPNCPSKEDAHKFYNTALVDIRAFNDGWRRHTAHVRLHQPPMSDEDAIALWSHVSRFLGTLATKIAEGKYTELIWP